MTLPFLPVCRAASVIAVGLSLGAGCAKGPVPCATTAACGEGTLCVAGRCRDAKVSPAPQSAQRVVLEPLDAVVVSSSGRHELSSAHVSFGKESWGEVVLLLRFPAPFRDTTQILSAHLVMDPSPGAIPGPGPVRLRLARVLEPWAPKDASWSTLPRLSSVDDSFLASSWGHRSLRLDVTEQVRRWREHRSDDQGLAVLASPQNEVGETYSLGLAGGRGPRLDVYLR